MSLTSHSKNDHTLEQSEKGFGFSGVNWSDYIKFRPIYPASFFENLFDYHSQKRNASWTTAHDVGAGCGIVSASLAPQFNNVIVSDPNDGYATLARKLLIEESRLSESKFRFLQESAENSSLGTATVDLITVCECIHWMRPDVAIQEFARQLRPGGTLMISLYTRPHIVSNERAQEAWKAIETFYAIQERHPQLDHALRIVNMGTEAWGFPEAEWESVERVYLNAKGSLDAFKINDLRVKSQVKEGEKTIWEEDVQGWIDEQDIDWFKGYVGTWSKPEVAEEDVKPLWDELERSLGGKKATISTPVALTFATRKYT